MKNSKLKLPLFMSGIALSLTVCSGAQAKLKPNIVIFLADDMGWGDLNLNGNNIVSTPAINALAKQSLSFDRFYVCPLSAPTRSEMLTGRYFLRTGVSSVTRGLENMRTGEVTIAEILKENGYATGCFGKWHNGGYYQQHPNRQGFDEYVGFMVGHLGYYFDAYYMNNDTEVKSDGYASDYFTGKALNFIEKNKDNPFLCYVPYNVPHSPFQVPEKYFNKYNSLGIDSTLSSVYGMVENMDDNISRILEKLDELKIRENTIVIFFSDNGPNTKRYNGDMKGIKGSVDEGGVRTPFYISWPGKIKSGITGQLAQDIDIMPTLLGLCNIQYSPVNHIDGIDLSGIVNGKKKQFDRYVFSRQGNAVLQMCSGSVRNDKYRLVRSVKDTLLFDMISDPFQKKNIFKQQKEVANTLLSALTKWENELVTKYKPVTTINAGFPNEKSFKLPVQDATLSGKIKYSSIHPNQSHTEMWSENGDSIFWKLNIDTGGKYNVELQYGCQESETGSKMLFRTSTSSIPFTIDVAYESAVLPERDYVKRSESVERTWSWMKVGTVTLKPGPEQFVVKLQQKKNNEAGIIKAIRLIRI
ncbi:MAG: arylsulfatase [Bacteroidales bacterium]|nr:arylsulfatase [Bacteroidales bacterium]